ncbi:pyridoxamine 5'-phosphate oxidase family protein [Fodinicola acaciae]|uniref:pyridoxamine 5'-phosphate oxidase family protein n=1 Tax=Fodinicola acaciae TaxID=2681555 RepID=UPI0013D61322|nr:pyridoxamine 5'-phosphate oxidase family protein [Fodinicola acaciae]
MSRYANVAYTTCVRKVQEEQGSARAATHALLDDGPDPLTAAEAGFISERDGCYVASVGETGWPYVQFRGGPPGFVHVLDEHTLAFADVRGNRQYITTGNLRGDNRVALFFMDYARQRRLKVFGRARTVELADDPELAERVQSVRTDGRPERIVVIQVEGLNWNCAQHITPRYSEVELSAALQPVRDRISRLERENQQLREALARR